MNVYSFIIKKNNYMARNIDINKIERIKKITLEMVVNNGYWGASISKIAKEAKVAEGYLYRFYKSKSELVNDLLYSNVNELADNMEEILNGQHSVWEVFKLLIQRLIDISKKNPEKIKFLYSLIHDYNFSLAEEQKKRIYNLCRKIKEFGKGKNELRENITEEQIYLVGVGFPIQFINLRLKNFFNKSELSEDTIEEIFRICYNSLKN